jgi:hypothetical protein
VQDTEARSVVEDGGLLICDTALLGKSNLGLLDPEDESTIIL